MTKSDNYIQDRILWRAEKNGFPSETIYAYEKLDASKKETFNKLVESCDLGIPVVYFDGENNSSTVLCTRGIIGSSNNAFDSTTYSNVLDHTIGDIPFWDSEDEGDDDDDDDNFDKLGQHKILLKDNTDKVVTLHTTKNGKDVFTLYNLLIMLFRMAGVEN